MEIDGKTYYVSPEGVYYEKTEKNGKVVYLVVTPPGGYPEAPELPESTEEPEPTETTEEVTTPQE